MCQKVRYVPIISRAATHPEALLQRPRSEKKRDAEELHGTSTCGHQMNVILYFVEPQF